MSAHTPGPWTVGSWAGQCKKTHDGMRWHPGASHATDPCVYESFLLEGGVGIAASDGAMVVESTYEGLVMSEADGALIAAAPDLLAALRNCLAQLEIITGKVHDERCAIIDAHAAIAKATGAQP